MQVLEFRKEGAVWVEYSPDGGGRQGASGSTGGPGAVLGQGEVLAGSAVPSEGPGARAAEVRTGRVLRVRWCPACGTWYGAYYPADTVAAADAVQHFCENCCRPAEFLDHWPNRHGESRALVRVGEFDAERGLEVPDGSRWRPALGPAQQELDL